jgi:hypothetical protein
MAKKVTHPAKKKPAARATSKNDGPTAERMRQATKVTPITQPRRKAMTDTPATMTQTKPPQETKKAAPAPAAAQTVVFEVPEVNMPQKRQELIKQAEEAEAANDAAYAEQVADLKKFAEKASY